MPDGREWRYLGRGEVEASDGRRVGTYRYRGQCRICSAPFEMDTLAPRPSARRAGGFALVSCPAHRLHRRPSNTPRKVAERIHVRSTNQVYTLVDRSWHRSVRSGKLLRMGTYESRCQICTAVYTVKSKLHHVGQTIRSYLRTTRCKPCRDRRLTIRNSDLV
jgi:hypothetical protein